MEKRTKRDNYKELMAVVKGELAVKDCHATLLKDFITHELELLDRKRSADNPKSATAKRRAENAVYQDAILEILRTAEEPLTIKGIQSLADAPVCDFSTSKMSALLKVLKDTDKVIRTEVKKVVYWSAVVEADETAEAVEDTAEADGTVEEPTEGEA